MKLSKHTALLMSTLLLSACQPNAQQPPLPAGPTVIVAPGASAAPAAAAPVIASLDYTPKSQVSKDAVIAFNLVATNPMGGELQYSWTTTKGTLTSTAGASASWKPLKEDGSLETGIAVVRVIVSNGQMTSTGTVNIFIDPEGKAVVAEAPKIENATGAPAAGGGTPAGGSTGGGTSTQPTAQPTTAATAKPSALPTPTGLKAEDPTMVGTLGARPGSAGHTSAPTRYMGSYSPIAARPDGKIVAFSASPENNAFALLTLVDPARFIGDPQFAITLAGGKTAEYLPGTGQEAGLGRGDYAASTVIACDDEGNTYVFNYHDPNNLMKVSPSGEVTRLGGNPAGIDQGPITNVNFQRVQAMCADEAGNLYVFSKKNSGVRLLKIDASLNVSILDGSDNGGVTDGANFSGTMNNVSGAACEKDGSAIYFVDSATKAFKNPDESTANPEIDYVRRWTPGEGFVTLAGGLAPTAADAERFTPGTGTNANVGNISGNTRSLGLDDDGNLYVMESSRVIKVDPSGKVSSLAGAKEGGYKNGSGDEARFSSLSGGVYSDGVLYLQESGHLRTIKIK